MAFARLLRIGAVGLALAQAAFAASQATSSPPRPTVASARRSPADLGFETVAKKAAAAREAGRLDEAVSHYRKGVALQPKWAEGLWYLGTLLYEREAFGEARTVLRSLVELTPKSGPAWAFLGLSEFGLADYASALPHIERARDLGLGSHEPLILVARYHAAILSNRARRFDAATQLLVAIARSQPEDPNLLLALGLNLLKRPLLPSEVKGDERPVVEKGGRAAYAQATGRYEDARRAFEELSAEHGGAKGVAQAYRAFLSTYAIALVDPEEREEAAARFRARLSDAPQDFEANLYLGLLLGASDLPEAGACLTKAAQARPASLEAAYELARVQLAAGKTDEARAGLEAVVARDPGFGQAQSQLASAYEKLGRASEAAGAREAASRLTGSAPSPSRASSAADGQGAGAAALPAIRAKADAARKSNRVEEAVRLYRQGVALVPSWDEGLWHLGTLLYDLGQVKEAQQPFLRLVNLRPEGGAGWAFLGLCEFRLGEHEEALGHLVRARALGVGGESLLDNVQYHIAVLLSRRGEFEAALQILMAFASNGNDTPGVIEALGIATLRLPNLPAEVPGLRKPLVAEAGRAAFYHGAKRLVDARKAYEDLVHGHPDEANVHYAFAVFLLTVEPERALEEFRRELGVSPGHVFARLHLAFEHLKRSDYAAARPFAEEAARLAPQNFAARNALGRVLIETGEMTRGISELEAGARIAPDSPEMQFALARAYAQAGRSQEADKSRAEFRRLLEVRNANHQAQSGSVAAVRPPQPETLPQ